ncbi:MAG TPA: hypothetical protein ENH92_05925 [Ectothiorhodospiraceae bacterium]|nr:hypothetical protein [Ectothiorhodospiraceae bacterium]
MLSALTIKPPKEIWIVAIVALVFGALTVKAGGLVLFSEGEFHQLQGSFVPFVVWFNFIAGFAYIIAAIGIFCMCAWSIQLSYAIAIASASFFILFGMHVIGGGSYELHTVVVMTIRTLLWIAISFVVHSKIIPASDNSATIANGQYH